MMPDNGWLRTFEDPITLPDGRTLFTLRDVADYITSLPEKETDLPDWQVAMEALLLMSLSGPTMLARIGVMNALKFRSQRYPLEQTEALAGTNDCTGCMHRPDIRFRHRSPIRKTRIRGTI
jgi:hypothetical protein